MQNDVNKGRVVWPASIDENFKSAQENFTELYNAKNAQVAAVTTDPTAASGSCGVQFVFLDGEGNALTAIASGIGYVSDADGAVETAVDGLEVLTNGGVIELVTGSAFVWVTDATGKLGVTLTEAVAGDYYLSFVLPNGQVITSGALTVNE